MSPSARFYFRTSVRSANCVSFLLLDLNSVEIFSLDENVLRQAQDERILMLLLELSVFSVPSV